MTADEAEAPLLDRTARSSQDPQQRARPFVLSSESTPLLQRSDEDGLLAYGTDTSRRLSSGSNLSTSGRSSKNRKWWTRWPLVFVLVLLMLVLGVLVFAFVTPVVVRRYAEQAAVFEPTDISVDSATTDGLRARVQGNFVVDANRIKSGPVRNVGRLATWIGREVETSQTGVDVYLPEYGNVLIGTASVPSVTVNVRNGHTNQVDVLADLATGDIPGIRAVAMDWLEGRLGRLRVKGKATLHLKSGIFGLGAQTIFKSVTFEEDDFPALPEVKVHKLIAHDADEPAQNGTMVVDSSVATLLDVPFSIRIPPLGFEVLVSNCLPGDPFISVSDVRTQEVQIVPNRQTDMNIRGIIQGLSDELTTSCPGQKDSPLDSLVRSYMNGHQTTVYVRGAQNPPVGTPSWVVDFLKSVTVPFHFTGHALDNMIKNFTMSDMHFSLPDPFADPNSPEALPSVSALVSVTIGLPKQLNLTVDIPRVRANANIFYEGDELGVLELHKWQPANSTRVMQENGLPALFVNFTMKDVPLRVTNGDVLTKVIQTLIFQGKSVELHVAATVDAEVATGLGAIAVRGIPAGGDVNVKSLYGDTMDQLNPRIVSLELGPTTDSSALINTKVNITNPTNYSAIIPMADFVLLYNATTVAHIIIRNVSVIPGMNTGIAVDILWSPLDADGSDGVSAGQEMISQYISGLNTTVTIKAHRGTFPSLPHIGEGLSKLELGFQIPKVPVPRSPERRPGDDGPHFIQSTTTVVEVIWVNATAFYGQAERIGRVYCRRPFYIPPGISNSPRLPVDLDLGGVGHSALRKALGSTLEISAVAEIGVRIGNYTDIITYRGKGISAHVRI